MPPASEHDVDKLIERITNLEDEAGLNAERFDKIMKGLERLTVAVSGDAENDILGVIGRMRLIDADIAVLKKQQIVVENELSNIKTTAASNAVAVAEWTVAKHQLAGASKVGRALWAFIGAGGLVVVWKAFQLFSV